MVFASSQELLMKMPKGGSLINTARTEVVHEVGKYGTNILRNGLLLICYVILMPRLIA